LLLTPRYLAKALGRFVLQIDFSQEVVYLRRSERDAVQAGVQSHDLNQRETRVKARSLQLDSEPGLGLQRVSAGVDLSDHYASRRRAQQSFDGAQRAGLARTVGTQQSIDLPLANLEINTVNGDDRTIGNAKPADPQRECQGGAIGLRRCQGISSNRPAKCNRRELGAAPALDAVISDWYTGAIILVAWIAHATEEGNVQR
jgi:hypothetical protein